MTSAGKNIRFAIFAVLLLSISSSVAYFYPEAKKLLATYSISYYDYEPGQQLEVLDTSALPPATAVPILMYHGVMEERDDVNTTLDVFISQMEMLKKEGYETISVAEYDLFRQGKFTLPAKPIIITFDDGRKDSYYTTDDVLKKLGFKATIFVASGPATDGNPFYLTWDELRKMHASGRWEIEAHGRYSHSKVHIHDQPKEDPRGDGRYLTSRVYLTGEKRLETVEEYEKRVEADYQNGVSDLREKLGVNPQYFAIPLNDYGQQDPSNYELAPAFNQSLIKKYFKIAFVQANDSDNVYDFRFPVYNFKNDDPYFIRRIEVKNMDTPFLKDVLEKQMPMPADLSLSENLVVQADNPDENGEMIFGQSYWKDYSVKAEMSRDVGRSASLLFYYKDSKNYMSFGLTDNGYFVRSTVNGTTTNLRLPHVTSASKAGFKAYQVDIKDGYATCSVNGTVIYTGVPVPLEGGAVGFRVWDDAKKAEGTMKSLVIKQL